MRHRKSGRKLSRTSAHRKALGRNLTIGLVKQFGVDNREYIVTTLAKAKEYRCFVEKMITIAKKAIAEDPGSQRRLALLRRALKLLPHKPTVKRLFDDIAPRYTERAGGYTRVIKTAECRVGDGSRKVLLAFMPSSEGEVADVKPVVAEAAE